jgi:tetratricopeptide (TPR) repeat protein
LAGLKPVDWKSIQAAKAKYFQGVLEDWQKRVRIARNEGRPGDILTLAADAPTRYHHAALLYRAASALIDLNRMNAAQSVLEELLEVDRDHFEARCLLGQVLARLGHYAKAEEELRNAVQLRQGDPEAHGMLGRVYKDMWRSRWQDYPEVKERQQSAIDYASLAAKAASSYGAAFQARLNSYYLGINLLGLQKLLEHLEQITGECASWPIELSPEAIATIVRIGAAHELKKSRQESNIAEEAWAAATLGELELLTGNEKEALRMYQSAGALPGISYFQFDSMRSQLELYRLLGFHPDTVEPIIKKLDRYIDQTRKPAPDFENVILFSGHIIDRPGRKEPRFPPEKEVIVRQRIAAQLDEWKIGQSDLAMCGGAAGGDILFAELCLERGAHVRLLLASPLPEFMESSVRLPTGNWDVRLRA